MEDQDEEGGNTNEATGDPDTNDRYADSNNFQKIVEGGDGTGVNTIDNGNAASGEITEDFF